MGLFERLRSKPRARDALIPLYTAIVAEARTPEWYTTGAVADTVDGRFDMVALIVALVMFRLEALGETAAEPAVQLTEIFIDAMDGELRRMGIDYTVGKHIGKMMSALGGRLGAYREARHDDTALREALVRNLFRGAAPSNEALDYVAARVRALDTQISTLSLETLRAGKLS